MLLPGTGPLSQGQPTPTRFQTFNLVYITEHKGPKGLLVCFLDTLDQMKRCVDLVRGVLLNMNAKYVLFENFFFFFIADDTEAI